MAQTKSLFFDDINDNLCYLPEDNSTRMRKFTRSCCSVSSNKDCSSKYKKNRTLPESKGSILECHNCKKHFTKTIRFKRNSSKKEENEQYCYQCLQQKNRFKCDICNKSFSFESCLSIHYRSHMRERSFECEFCGRSFARKQALQCHYRTHTGEKPYSCDICGKNFTQISNLANHNRKHMTEKLCECCMCKKTFVHHFKISQESKDQFCDLCKESKDILEKLSKPLEMFTQSDFFVNLPALL